MGALRSLGVPADALVVRSLAAAELALGGLALTTTHWAVAVLVAASYATFTGFTSAALARNSPVDSCGCLGRLDTPPSWRHLVVLGAALVGAIGVAADPSPSLVERLTDDGGGGIAFVVVAVVLATVAVALMRAGRRPSTP